MLGRKQARIADLEFELKKAHMYIAKLERDIEIANEWLDHSERLVSDRDATIRRLTSEILDPKIVNPDLKARP